MKVDISFKQVKYKNHAILTITDYPPLIVVERECGFRETRGVAQRLARMVWDHEVGGSNPLTPTIIIHFLFYISPRKGLFTDLCQSLRVKHANF